MRADNVILVMVSMVVLAFVVTVIVRWGRLPVHAASEPPVGPKAVAIDAIWSLAAVLSAGMVAGYLVAGVIGRLIMRIAGGVSPESVQGRFTEAGEVIGEITLAGSLAFAFFGGLFIGLVAVAIYLVARPWMPTTGRAAGVIVGVLTGGLLGPGDPLDPENIDFALLSYDALVVALFLAGAVLFGLTFGALVGRFDQAVRGVSKARFLVLLGYLIMIVPPVLVASIVYVGGRTLVAGRLQPFLASRPVQVTGRVILLLLVAIAVVRLGSVAVDIIRA